MHTYTHTRVKCTCTKYPYLWNVFVGASFAVAFAVAVAAVAVSVAICLDVNGILQLFWLLHFISDSANIDYHAECSNSVFSLETIKDWTKCEKLQQVHVWSVI